MGLVAVIDNPALPECANGLGWGMALLPLVETGRL